MRLTLASLLACWLANAASAQSPLVVVDPGGPVTTLTQALRLAPRHGRILVRAGTYREPRLLVDRPVTIEGEGWPVFVGGDHEVFTVTADSVTIRELAISRIVATGAEDRAAIRLSGVRHCRVENTRLDDTFFGIYLAKSADCLLEGNIIRGRAKTQGLAGNAIHSWNSSHLTIRNN